MVKGDGFVSATIYAAIYAKNHKYQIKEELETYFSSEKNNENSEIIPMLIKRGSEENLYHLHLEVPNNESERIRKLLYDWLNKHNSIQVHIAPCIEK